MTQYFANLVGSRFRESGSLILPVLEVDTPLILEPEPDNHYDPEAVKVCVDMALTKFEYNRDAGNSGPVVHLGYLPRSGTRTDTLGFGNREALRVMQGGPNWSAFLSFDPAGSPLVRIEVYDEAA